MNVTPALERLFVAIGALVRAGDGSLEHWTSPDVASGLDAAMRSALGEPDLLPDDVLEPLRFGFATYLLHTEPSFTVFSSVTAPWSVPPVHDHGSWGMVGLYRGVEEEIRFEPESAAAGGAAPQLVARDRVTLCAGDVIAVRPPRDIHCVLNRGDQASVGVHLFRHDIAAQGFVVYEAPAYLPAPTGPVAYDGVLNSAT